MKSDDYQVSFYIKRAGTLPVEMSKINTQIICG
jgi:dynein heavy chain